MWFQQSAEGSALGQRGTSVPGGSARPRPAGSPVQTPPPLCCFLASHCWAGGWVAGRDFPRVPPGRSSPSSLALRPKELASAHGIPWASWLRGLRLGVAGGGHCRGRGRETSGTRSRGRGLPGPLSLPALWGPETYPHLLLALPQGS